MQYLLSYFTDCGEIHPVNQDSFFIKQMSAQGEKLIAAGLFDGVGSLHESERISGAAAKAVSFWIAENSSLLFTGNATRVRDSLFGMLDSLNEKVRNFCSRTQTEAGATAVIMILFRGRALVCNVGDSRAYRITGQKLIQLTEDHNMAGLLRKAGLQSKEDSTAGKNILLQALGTVEKLAPTATIVDFADDEAFLLCSDGFYSSLKETELIGLDRTENTKEALAQALKVLTLKARDRGETDNITSILIKTVK